MIHLKQSGRLKKSWEQLADAARRSFTRHREKSSPGLLSVWGPSTSWTHRRRLHLTKHDGGGGVPIYYNAAMRLYILLLAVACSAQTYTLQESRTTENLRGLSTPTSGIAWAAGTHGTYLRTTDAGKDWTAEHVPGADSLDFRDVEAFDADRAYLLAAGPGEQSRIYKTSDAGKHWTLQFTNRDPKGFFDCMAFWDANHGIALGDPINNKFELIRTDDGGKTWASVPGEGPPSAIEGEGAFAASGTCITTQGKNNVWFVTGGAAARVFRSTDRGSSWQAVDTPLAHGADSSGIFSIAFSDATYGVIAGGDYKHPDQDGPSLAFTQDGGRTWTLASTHPQLYTSAVAIRRFPSTAFGVLAVGSGHATYTDDVRKANSTEAGSSQNLNSVSFLDPSRALAVGPKGSIVLLTGFH